MISKTNLQIDEQILKIDRVICRHISNMSNLSRGEISQVHSAEPSGLRCVSERTLCGT